MSSAATAPVTAANGANSSSSKSASNAVAGSKADVQPSEVGWLFVTQYYTFLNQNPNRLHCFFNKKSTMVHGTEQQESSPCFGQQQIHEKITSLNFEDAKVFVTNVDSQSSASGGIIVQVLGELSNKGGAWKKFAQTFFLAEQPNGYFVLNDIFRYLKDEEETEQEAEDVDEAIDNEIKQADAEGKEVVHQVEINNIGDANAVPNLLPPTSAAASKSVESSAAPAIEAAEPRTEETAASVKEVEEEVPVTTTEVNAAKSEETAAAAAPAEPVAEEKKETAPAEPAAPPKPKTWATLAASGVTRWGSNVSSEAKGVSSSRPTSTSSPAPSKSGAAAAKAHNAVTPSSSSASLSTSVYLKNVVPDQVSESALRSALQDAFGPVKDLQMIPTRSCAFADFGNAELAKKALAKANISVGKNGWNVVIEERRKPGANNNSSSSSSNNHNGAGAARGGGAQRGGRGGSGAPRQGGGANTPRGGGAGRGGRPTAS